LDGHRVFVAQAGSLSHDCHMGHLAGSSLAHIATKEWARISRGRRTLRHQNMSGLKANLLFELKEKLNKNCVIKQK
jgi:hypothetical protein